MTRQARMLIVACCLYMYCLQVAHFVHFVSVEPIFGSLKLGAMQGIMHCLHCQGLSEGLE